MTLIGASLTGAVNQWQHRDDVDVSIQMGDTLNILIKFYTSQFDIGCLPVMDSISRVPSNFPYLSNGFIQCIAATQHAFV